MSRAAPQNGAEGGELGAGVALNNSAWLAVMNAWPRENSTKLGASVSNPLPRGEIYPPVLFKLDGFHDRLHEAILDSILPVRIVNLIDS